MSNVVPLHQPRTLAHVLVELATADAEMRRIERRWYCTRDDRDADASAALDDKVFALKDEAKAMIGAAVGVDWAAIEGANL